MNKEILNKEIKDLEKYISKIENKTLLSYFGIIIGVVICIYSIIFYMQNSDLLSGSVSLFIIGSVVILLNYLTLKRRNKRINELKKDLEKSKELLDSKEG
jgi:uncharacterized protein YacL